jgi:hypothetical protein
MSDRTVHTLTDVQGEVRMNYEQHKELLTAIVFAGLTHMTNTDNRLDVAKEIVSEINGEAEFE